MDSGAIEYSIAQSAENNNAAKTLTSTNVSTTELPFGSIKYFFNAKQEVAESPVIKCASKSLVG